MSKRIIEIFVAGCPLCNEVVKQVQGLTCSSCEIHILDMQTDKTAQAKAAQYGVRRVPSIVVNGALASCCDSKPVDLATLGALGVGRPL